MLKDSFFTIQSQTKQDDNTILLSIHLNENHPVYVGHFPEQPICPGVMTLGLVRESVETIVGKSLSWTNIKNSRFTGMMFPGNDVQLSLTLSNEEGAYVVKAVINRQEDGSETSLLTLSATLQ